MESTDHGIDFSKCGGKDGERLLQEFEKMIGSTLSADKRHGFAQGMQLRFDEELKPGGEYANVSIEKHGWWVADDYLTSRGY